jgi:hypothetical protein
MLEAMSIPAEVLKLRLHSRRLPEQHRASPSLRIGSTTPDRMSWRVPSPESPRSLFHGELDDMSDGTGHPKDFTS